MENETSNIELDINDNSRMEERERIVDYIKVQSLSILDPEIRRLLKKIAQNISEYDHWDLV